MANQVDLYKKRDENLRKGFDKVAQEYEHYRLAYPKELFNDIFTYCAHGQTALEIGIGTGKATLPFLEKGFEIVAVEPNRNMMAIAEAKYRNWNNLEIIQSKFEDYHPEKTFDLVYAASAFHWVKSEERLRMVYELLNKNGCFARFKTMNILKENVSENNDILREIYRTYIPDYLPDYPGGKHIGEDEYRRAGFVRTVRNTYDRDVSFSVADYIALINTYTEYIDLDYNLRKTFEAEIQSRLEAQGGVKVTQMCTLFMAARD